MGNYSAGIAHSLSSISWEAVLRVNLAGSLAPSLLLRKFDGETGLVHLAGAFFLSLFFYFLPFFNILSACIIFLLFLMPVLLKDIVLKNDFLHCFFEGEIENFQSFNTYAKQILNFAKEHNVIKALLDFSKCKGEKTLIFYHEFAMKLTEVLQHKYAVAILAPSHFPVKKEPHVDNVLILEGQFGKVFYDLSEAEEWIKEF